MPRSRAPRRYEDDEPEEDEGEEEPEDEEEEEPAPRRRPRTPPRRVHRRPRPSPVRRWKASQEDEEEEEEEEEELPAARRSPRSGTKPVYWRARDSLFFEPLVAVAIIVVLLVSLFAYTQNWPPMYVVESDSMQHGSSDQLGVINAGDLVLAQKVPFSTITPYVVGMQTGYSTYGEYGDVLLYWPNGQESTPVIHRALLYLGWNATGGFYNATDLAGLPCGSQPHAVFSVPGTTGNCNIAHLGSELDLYHIGWNSQNLNITLSPSILGDHSGFLTMGDGNSRPDQTLPEIISTLVEPGWILGVARGMIPWFGAIKLLLEGNAGYVPSQSWQFMGLTIAGIIALAYGIHYALRTEGIETPLRREEEEEARAETEAEAEAEPSGPSQRGWFSRHFRRHPEDEEEEESEARATRRRRSRPPPPPAPARRGRPWPHVRRSEKPSRRRRSDDEL